MRGPLNHVAKNRHWLARVEMLFGYHVPTLVRTELLRRFPRWYAHWAMRPIAAGLNITDNCNMRCVMCNSWRSHSADELTTDEWKQIITQLRDAGVRFVGFAGGEPLLRKDLSELVRHAKACGLRAELTTSGYLLDEGRAEALFAAGLGSVVISVDGVGPQYEAIRGREWARVERACEILARGFRDMPPSAADAV